MLTNDEIEQMKGVVRKCIYGIPDSEGQVARDTLDKIVAELLTLHEAVAPKMAEVDAIVHRIVSYPHDDNYIPAMRLASMLRFSILYAKREYHRAEHKNDQLESQLALVSTLTVERDVAREEVADLQNQKTEMIQVIINHRDSIVNQSQKIDSLTAELAALRSAPGIDEVDEILRDVNSSMFDNQERLASITRRAIASREEEKQRADEVAGLLKWWVSFKDGFGQLEGMSAGSAVEEWKDNARRILEIAEGE